MSELDFFNQKNSRKFPPISLLGTLRLFGTLEYTETTTIVKVEIRDMKDAFSWCCNTNLLRLLLLLKAIVMYYRVSHIEMVETKWL